MDNTAENLPLGPDFSELSPLLLHGRFCYRTLHEANLLAQFIAKACPNPRLSIMGISELLINAVEHGNLSIGSEEKAELQHQNKWMEEIERRLNLPENKDKWVEIEIVRNETELRITVTDQGKGFDWQAFEKRHPNDPLSTHGRGILLAKQLVFKSLEYSGKGNIVTGVINLK
jgi:hypothetical protein